MRWAKKLLTDPKILGLITCSRIALTMWEGVEKKQWSFLSPPWLLRDKGLSLSNPAHSPHALILLGTRTGKYTVILDKLPEMDEAGVDQGVYNEDMAVAIVDEVEVNKLNHRHWTCVGPIGLKEW